MCPSTNWYYYSRQGTLQIEAQNWTQSRLRHHLIVYKKSEHTKVRQASLVFTNWCEMTKPKILLVRLTTWLPLKVDFLSICSHITVGSNFISCNHEPPANDFNTAKTGNYKNIRLFRYKTEWLNWLKLEGLLYPIHLAYFVNTSYSLISSFAAKPAIWFNFSRISTGLPLALTNSLPTNLRNIKTLFQFSSTWERM